MVIILIILRTSHVSSFSLADQLHGDQRKNIHEFLIKTHICEMNEVKVCLSLAQYMMSNFLSLTLTCCLYASGARFLMDVLPKHVA